MRNIFLGKQEQNMAEKLFPDPFLKIQLWGYLLISCGYTSCKVFLKNKERSGTSPSASFSVGLFKKIISTYVLLLD